MIDRETQKALLRKVIDKLQEGQDNDVKNSNHIGDEVVTGNQLVADRVDYLRQTITGEAKKQEKDGKKGKGDASEDARENRNLLSKIGNGISGLAQSTKDTAKASGGAVSGGKGLLESMGKMDQGWSYRWWWAALGDWRFTSRWCGMVTLILSMTWMPKKQSKKK